MDNMPVLDGFKCNCSTGWHTAGSLPAARVRASREALAPLRDSRRCGESRVQNRPPVRGSGAYGGAGKRCGGRQAGYEEAGRTMLVVGLSWAIDRGYSEQQDCWGRGFIACSMLPLGFDQNQVETVRVETR